jgi:organic radical activating enzyme
MFPIDEFFFSFQGEGLYSGMPQIFLRFSGCNIKCDYCDTPHALKISKETKWMSEDEILERLLSFSKENKHLLKNSKSLSLTGGEPLLQANLLKTLLPKIKKLGFEIYLETNGTLPKELKKIIEFCDVISMEFELPSSSKKDFWKQHKEFLKTAAKKEVFVKVVVSNNSKIQEIKKTAQIIRAVSKNIPLILQPSLSWKRPSINLLYDMRQAARLIIPNVFIMTQLHKIYEIK